MGSVKDMLTSTDGWMGSHDDKYVCANCIEDEALQSVIEDSAEEETCSYCGQNCDRPIAAPLDKVTEHIAMCISRVYTDPVEVLPYESREGGYQGTVYELDELFEEIELWVENEKLMDDIRSSFEQEIWCVRDWLVLSPDQRKVYGWEEFKDAVKHKRRYTFWSMHDPDGEELNPDHMPVAKMLDEIGKTIQTIGLIKSISPGTEIWRVRVHKEKQELKHDEDFTAPPVDKTKQPNRMSPAGVPMFYGAEDYETACLETVDRGNATGKVATGGCFKTVVELHILDLADMPPVPSFFDMTQVDLRDELIFMAEFVRDMSQPIERDGREHIEYVPTQAFTEYIRWMMKTSDGLPIDGICYRSSKNGRRCYVLFCQHDACIDNPKYKVPKQFLRFDPKLLKTEKLS